MMLHGRRTLAAALVAVFAAAMGGCASGRAGEDGTAEGGPNRETVTVRVENDLNPPTDITVLMVQGSTGNSIPLGSVPPSSTRQLTFQAGAITGSYRLQARISVGNDRVSQPISLTGGEIVRWNLTANSVVVTRP